MTSLDQTADAARVPSSILYRAVWRWHFYAGIVVIPTLLMLSITGFFMLWFTAISPEYGDRLVLERAAQTAPFAKQQEAVHTAYPGRSITSYRSPLTPENPALFEVAGEAGARMVAVNPYTAAIVQDRAKDGTWNEWLTKIHGTLLIGESKGIGDFLVEIGASLGLVMVVTGLYLFWPRGTLGFAHVLLPRFTGGSRVIWKSLHSVTGFWISLVLVFFLFTGLAWTGVWGSRIVQAWSTFPAEKWDAVPLSTKTHESLNSTAVKEVPWTLEQTLLPQSGSTAGVTGLPANVPVNIESVAVLARALGLGTEGSGRFQIAAPADEKGVFTISRDSMSYDGSQPTGDATIHVDQYSGRILADVRYADYSLGGKAMAVGIALHEGMMGTWNLVLNFAFIAAIVFLCLSSIAMWWMRRPRGEVVAAPRYPRNFRLGWGAGLIGVVLAIVAPVGGLVIALFALIDWLLPKRFKEVARQAAE